jgi:hypothetical protein
VARKSRTPDQSTKPWRIHFFQRHELIDPATPVPGLDFLEACPVAVRAKFDAVLQAVAAAPPPLFGGGGKWEAMHGDMAGCYEARVDGAARHHYRLFCVLERNGAALGLGGPSIVVICGSDKAFRTKLSPRDYGRVRALVVEFRASTPRSVAR